MCPDGRRAGAGEGLTGWVEGQVRPSVVEEALLGAQLDGFDLAGEAGRGPEVLQAGHKLDYSANEGERDFSPEAVVDAVAEGLHRRTLGALAPAIGSELLRVRDVTGVACCLALRVTVCEFPKYPEEGGMRNTYEHQDYCASRRDRFLANLRRLCSNAHVSSACGETLSL